MVKEKRFNVLPEVLSCLLYFRLKTEQGAGSDQEELTCAGREQSFTAFRYLTVPWSVIYSFAHRLFGSNGHFRSFRSSSQHYWSTFINSGVSLMSILHQRFNPVLSGAPWSEYFECQGRRSNSATTGASFIPQALLPCNHQIRLTPKYLISFTLGSDQVNSWTGAYGYFQILHPPPSTLNSTIF
jgi:hypothetical protein